MYNAHVFEILISAPSDVKDEINLIEEVINTWNRIDSKKEGIILKSLWWKKDTHPLQGRPQGVIDKQILEKSDILIGVFWTRIGSPTKDENGIEYISGSAEEIEKHINYKKPAMLYFSKKPVALDSVDMEQYKKLKEFKEKYQSKAFIHEYNEPDKNIFYEDLRRLMQGDEVRSMLQHKMYNIKINDSYKIGFEWQYEDGPQGYRTWYKESKYLWKEVRENESEMFVCIEEIELNNIHGTVARILVSSENHPVNFQVFIPDKNQTDMRLWWSVAYRPKYKWKPFARGGEIKYFD